MRISTRALKQGAKSELEFRTAIGQEQLTPVLVYKVVKSFRRLYPISDERVKRVTIELWESM